ncbi:MAG: hypothetical protein HC854_12880 [Flavobacterium sp.]|nr:hypothetical protein [Flavobacterium sp.]
MDLPDTIMGAIFFLIIIVPIVLINKGLNKKRNFFIAKLNEFALKENKVISEFDSWTDNTIIGISSDNEYIFFLREIDENKTQLKIAVNKIKNCFIKEHKNDRKTIVSLELVFELNDRKENIVLEFFKADAKNFIMGEEMRIAKKWKNKIMEDYSKT